MRTGSIYVDGMIIGYIDETYVINGVTVEASLDAADIPDESVSVLSGRVGHPDMNRTAKPLQHDDSQRAHHFPGHAQGHKEQLNQHHYPGHAHHPASGRHHYPGHHVSEPHAAHGSGAPQPILDKARDVALHGGSGAVQRFMAEQGYPKDGNWCGEFAAAVVKSTGGTPPKGPAVASNWRKWGAATDTPSPGDIAVRRGTPTGHTGSHVTIVEHGIDPKTGRFEGIGGNQRAWESNFPASQYEFRHGDSAPAASAKPTTPTTPGSVRGSWFDDRSTATALSAATTPGIALPSREGLGKMHEVTGPNGKKVMLPQIDVGPAKWTGRGVDISKAALSKFGYNAKDFPTDAHFKVDPVKMPTSTEPM